jgi:hypothetical protein
MVAVQRLLPTGAKTDLGLRNAHRPEQELERKVKEMAQRRLTERR